MKANSMLYGLAILALVASGATRAGEREEPVAVDVTGLQPRVAAAVTKHAEQGMTALSRYLQRTHMQHGLRVEDVIRKRDAQPVITARSAPKEYRRHAFEYR